MKSFYPFSKREPDGLRNHEPSRNTCALRSKESVSSLVVLLLTPGYPWTWWRTVPFTFQQSYGFNLWSNPYVKGLESLCDRGRLCPCSGPKIVSSHKVSLPITSLILFENLSSISFVLAAAVGGAFHLSMVTYGISMFSRSFWLCYYQNTEYKCNWSKGNKWTVLVAVTKLLSRNVVLTSS